MQPFQSFSSWILVNKHKFLHFTNNKEAQEKVDLMITTLLHFKIWKWDRDEKRTGREPPLFAIHLHHRGVFFCAQGASTRNMMKHCQSSPKFKLLYQFNSHQITKITCSHIRNNCLGNRSKYLLSHLMDFGSVFKLLMSMLSTILEGIKLLYYLYSLCFFLSCFKMLWTI